MLFALLLGLVTWAFLLLMNLLAILPAKPHNLPPGTMGWLPFIGDTIAFLKPHNSHSLGTFLQDHCLRYGRVFKSHLLGSPAIVSCDLELNKFILQNEGKLFKAYYPKAMHNIIGNNSVIFVSGDLHKKLRNIIVSFIHPFKSQPKFLWCVEKLSISMVKSWNDRTQVSFFKEAKTFILSVMLKCLLNIEPGDPLASKILKDLETSIKGFFSLPILIPGTTYHKAVKARERFSSTVIEIMKKRVVKGPKVGLGDEEDFLDMIMKKQNLNDEEKLSVVLDVLLGSYETTSTLMSLIVYFLGQAPHVLEKLKEEHQVIRQNKKEGEPLNWEDYKKMEFTYYVTCEALRCGNIAKFVFRKAQQDVKYKDILIPSGWTVIPIFTGVHFDQSLHDKPHEFNPWRWTDKEIRKNVTPFGGGPRLCPGAELAKVMIGFSFHHIVLNYRFHPMRVYFSVVNSTHLGTDIIKWKTKADDLPLAYPYVEFRRGLNLDIELVADHILNI